MTRLFQTKPTNRNRQNNRRTGWPGRVIRSVNTAQTLSSFGLMIMLSSPATAGEILSTFPQNPTPDQRYIIYLHGRIIETEGIDPVSPRFGQYEYRRITVALAQGNADVIADVRHGDTDVFEYTETLALKIEDMIAQGVRADHITVAGFSKGGYMTLLTANALQNPSLRYVAMAGCVEGIVDGSDTNADGLQGAMLSLVDEADDLGFSCAPLFARNTHLSQTQDITFSEGTGHGVFYRADQRWIDAVFMWSQAGEN